MDKKQKAIALLREHDALKARLRLLERETAKAVADYGVTQLRTWGLSIDKFRMHLEIEQEAKEQANART